MFEGEERLSAAVASNEIQDGSFRTHRGRSSVSKPSPKDVIRSGRPSGRIDENLGLSLLLTPQFVSEGVLTTVFMRGGDE